LKSHRSIILKIHELLETKKISCVELIKKYLDEIKKNKFNAYITVTENEALNSAALVDKKISSGQEIKLLEGIPVSLKDVISTKGIRTTCGSRMLENYVPIYNATCWEILKNNGAILLGKNNQDEFAMGASNETSFFGPVKNPYDITKVPGGSTGGGAASVVGGLAAFSIGTDTGGSLRQPASFCGIVGLKPSYGSVSRYGIIPMASSFDQAGPLTLTVKDASIVYDAISKFDEKDSSSNSQARNLTYDSLDKDISGIRIGIPKEFMNGMNSEIISSIKNVIKTYENLGAKIDYFSLPEVKYAMSIYYVLMCAEASSNLGRFDGIRYGFRPKNYNNVEDLIIRSRSEGFGDEVKRRILLGTYILSSSYTNNFYKKAQELREFLTCAFASVFEEFDIILLPTTPTTAFGFDYAEDDPIKMYLADVCTVTANEIKIPAISIPCGFDKQNLPIGVQLFAPRFREDILLNAAYKYESENFCVKIVDGVNNLY
jgi:aspartyl-tRNA(Asn)/glutamyl-tRNA(Gln) amidotransferase subunit A